MSWSQTLRNWRTWTRQESILEASMQKKYGRHKGGKFFLHSQEHMPQQNCQEETTKFREPTLGRKQPVRSEDLRGELQGEPDGLQPAEAKDVAEAR